MVKSTASLGCMAAFYFIIVTEAQRLLHGLQSLGAKNANQDLSPGPKRLGPLE